MENIADIYELSPMQHGMLFHTLYAPKSGVYFQQLSCAVQGKLNVGAFKQAWQQVVDRHPILRTSFYWQELEKPLQVVYSTVDLPWVHHDWLGLTPTEQQEHLENFLVAEREEGFVLDKAPLMRFALMKLREDIYQFVWNYHHLLMDGWCIPIIFEEVLAFYQTLNNEQKLSLRPVPPYRDYITWLQRQDPSQAEMFWRKALQGFTVPTPLVVDRVIGDKFQQQQQEIYDEQQIQFTEQTTAALQSFARKHQLTLNNLVQGAWALLLARYSGEPDVVFGVTVSGRPPTIVEVEFIVGLFINTLPMRVEVSEDIQLLPWLKKMQVQLVDCEQYSYSPLVEIQGWSEVPRGMPLFESIVVFENYPANQALQQDNGSLKISHIQSLERTNYPLTVTAFPGVRLSVSMSYDMSRFDAATITRMLGHFQVLLEAMVATPQQYLSQLSLLTASEQHQLLFEWNQTQADYPKNKCIHQLFEEQVERTPDAVAVVFDNQQLTYRELNCRANQLAHYLQTLGVGPDVLVGICVERSLEMVVGLLGILKAGGAYVPLDPDYPPQRLSFMLEDARVSVLLTQEWLVTSLPKCQATIVCLAKESYSITQQNQTNYISGVTSDNLAYLIYTSGSTGKPKGVQISHRAVVNFLFSMNQQLGITLQDRLLAVTTISFDIAVLELFVPMTVGASLVIASREITSDGKQLLDLLVKSQVTVMQATPTTWRLLLEAEWEIGYRLKILCGGEALAWELANQLLARSTFLWNLYGPTETTIWSVIYLVKSQLGLISIGRPIANTQIYILDSNLQCVPIGVPGELYIGGAGLAQGYLNRPELTAEKFIPNPFFKSDELEESNSRRLYKTGDQARYTSDGNIEYLGRIDHQVKIRGFRIELAEIESVVLQHPHVQAVVVIAREYTLGDQRLVAYLVSHQNQTPTMSELQQFLKQKLPDYMIPTAFVFLEALPLTPNGKVDRRNLPAPDMTQELEKSYVAPRNATEEILALIWADVLGVQLVGIHDNFFSLGGHSLLATQLISRVRTTFEVELPLRTLFEAATVAELAQELKQFQQGTAQLKAPPLVAIARDGQLPLSFAQQRLWFLDQLEPNSAFYNIPAAAQLNGQLNIAALEHSLREIIRRHEALRTNFITLDGQPVQIINPLTAWTLPVVDLRSVTISEQQMSCVQLATQEAQRPFHLEKEPLVRGNLLVLEETKHILLVTMHHIVSDGWSMGIVVRELSTLYTAFCQGQPSPLEELPIQYADFAVWQRQWLVGDVLQSQLAYWQQQLAEAPALLELPTDRPRPAVQRFRGAHQCFTLPVELTGALHQLSRQQGVTLFMTLLAAFDILLYRYTGQTDILVGSPIANRNHSEIEGLIGFFVNTLVLRTHISGHLSFEELLGRVREVALGAYAHQDLPFEMLVEALHLERNLSQTPLFQVVFALQNAPVSEMELPGLTLSPLTAESLTAKFDLTLSLENTALGLVGTWEYNTDLFDASTIKRMAGHYQTLLEGIVASPEQPLSQLPLLTASEQQQLLFEWNETQADYPKNKCIHQLFEEQVERTPEAVAVVFENQQLTYSELNCRANQLAHYLQTLGVVPDVLVGICVERSLEMVVGLLAILKAGGAYVPLDPDYPPQRLSFMLEDSRVQVLLTQHQLVEKLPGHQAFVVFLDEEYTLASSMENPVTSVRASDLANVIYTSGSTGIPKGVMVQHQGLCNLAAVQIKAFDLLRSSRILQFASLSFDASIWEVVMGLLSGAKLYLGTKQSLLPGTPLIEVLSKYGITHVTLPPSALAVLPNTELPALQTMILAGEACSAEHIKQWSVGRRLFNAYGPTETTVCASMVECRDVDHQPPIGRPIANTQIYILDTNLQPVPIGVPGELHIGGIGLARGYLNRCELTEEKFIVNPIENSKSERLYKTGDLGGYRSDGNIEYIGRIDHQVKIRGFRIELAEIESLLAQHPDVQAVVVIAREDTPGNKSLVAYLVSHQEQTPTINELRRLLLERLPEYMVPRAFVFLDTLPLTPNGKVDRSNLPAPDMTQALKTGYVAPRNPIEEILVLIWADVLGVQLVGIDDNFFSLGGHSLLATQLISRVRTAFQVELPLRTLFEAATVADFALVLKQSQQNVPELKAPPLEAIARDGQLPLSFAQQRLWFLYQLEPNNAFYNIPGAVELRGQLNIAALEHSLREIIRRHEVLRTNFITQDRQPVQTIHPPNSWILPLIDWQHLRPSEQELLWQQLAAQEATRPFNLAQEPLVRTTLVLLSDTEYRLLFTIHHIVFDGWSMGVLIHELAALYTAFSQDLPSPLKELPIQYADFALWQRQWLVGDVLQSQLAYWQQQLANYSTLQLPTVRPRSAVEIFTGTKQSLVFTKALSENLNALCLREGVTPFMTLLTAFKILLYYHSVQDDIVVGTDVANRNQAEIEPLIGFFVNQLVLRTNLSGNPTFRGLLKRVRQTTLDAYAHQNLPFDKLVAELNPERDLNHMPLLFPAKFVFQNVPIPTLNISNLTLSFLEIDNGIAKFDLMLTMWNTEEGLAGCLEYSTNLFNRDTINRMLENFETILDIAIKQPDIKLNVITGEFEEAERQKQVLTKEEYRETCHSKFKRVKPKPINKTSLEA